VSGSVVFGDYEFLGPKGYWYYPREFPPEGLKSGEDFIVTFFESRHDAGAEISRLAETAKGVIVNFRIFKNAFKNCRSLDEAVSKAYQSNNVAGIVVKKLPQAVSKELQNSGHWCCSEAIADGHEPLFTIDCVFLADQGIAFSLIGNTEKTVLDKIPMLKHMMESVTRGGRRAR